MCFSLALETITNKSNTALSQQLLLIYKPVLIDAMTCSEQYCNSNDMWIMTSCESFIVKVFKYVLTLLHFATVLTSREIIKAKCFFKRFQNVRYDWRIRLSKNQKPNQIASVLCYWNGLCFLIGMFFLSIIFNLFKYLRSMCLSLVAEWLSHCSK